MKRSPPDAAAVMARVITLKYIFVKGLSTPPLEYLAECKQRWSKEEWNKFLDDMRAQNLGLVERLRQSGLWNGMDQKEQSFIEAGPDEITPRARIDASWHMEAIVCLLWALGYVSEPLPYDQEADHELAKKLPAESVKALIKNAALRPREFIEKQRDVAELWHWRARTRRLQESESEITIPGGKTFEEIIQFTSAKAAASGDIPAPIGGDFPAFCKAYRDLTKQEYSKAVSIVQERHHALNWLCGLAPNNRWAETPTET